MAVKQSEGLPLWELRVLAGSLSEHTCAPVEDMMDVNRWWTAADLSVAHSQLLDHVGLWMDVCVIHYTTLCYLALTLAASLVRLQVKF